MRHEPYEHVLTTKSTQILKFSVQGVGGVAGEGTAHNGPPALLLPPRAAGPSARAVSRHELSFDSDVEVCVHDRDRERGCA